MEAPTMNAAVINSMLDYIELAVERDDIDTLDVAALDELKESLDSLEAIIPSIRQYIRTVTLSLDSERRQVAEDAVADFVADFVADLGDDFIVPDPDFVFDPADAGRALAMMTLEE